MFLLPRPGRPRARGESGNFVLGLAGGHRPTREAAGGTTGPLEIGHWAFTQHVLREWKEPRIPSRSSCSANIGQAVTTRLDHQLLEP